MFVMINKRLGGGGQFLDLVVGHSFYEGNIELMGGPPTRENPVTRMTICLKYEF